MDRCQVWRWYHVKKQMCMVYFNNRDWILTSLITSLGSGIQQGLKRPAYVHRTKWNLMFLCHISFSFILYMQSLYLEKIPELWDTPEKGSEYVCISQYKLCYATVMILRSQWPSGLTLFSSFVGSSPGQLWLLPYVASILGLRQMEKPLPWAVMVIRRAGEKDSMKDTLPEGLAHAATPILLGDTGNVISSALNGEA